MEMNAYYKGYIDDAQDALGNMMDYAVNSCNLDPDEFYVMFLSSGVAEQFGKGNPRYVTGMSGAELAKEVVLKVTGKELDAPEDFFIDKSPEYWCGWILAYYQWYTGRSLKKIYQVLPINELLCMYTTHHEADVERFIETVNFLYNKRHNKTYLQQVRENAGLNIKELAIQVGMDDETLTKMESDFSLINATDAVIVLHLAQVLGCSMEELLEI